MSRKPVFIGNWKMNMLPNTAKEYVSAFCKELGSVEAEVALAAPFTLLPVLAAALKEANSQVAVCSQNVHWAESGAHTGEISAEMLAATDVKYAIIGHSERRTLYGETDENVAKRSIAAIKAGITSVVCLGETQEQYEAGSGKDVVESQIKLSLAGITGDMTDKLVIAYEPVWAIGTGLTATPEYAEEIHAHIRSKLAEIFSPEAADAIRITYGGSVKPANVKDLMAEANIDGALVGGASLSTGDFSELIRQGAASEGQSAKLSNG